MSILLTSQTKIICQGILSPNGLSCTEKSLASGAQIVGAVAAGHGGEEMLGLPLYNTVEEACQKHKPQISVIYSTADKAPADILEAAACHIPWIICTTDGIPVHEILRVKRRLRKSKSRLIGPASSGIITGEECQVGKIPAHLFSAGNIGIISRSSSLLNEASQQLIKKGLGVSTCVSLGAYPILGSNFIDIFELFCKDKNTKAVLVIGEIGGKNEQKLAEYYRNIKRRRKPLVCYIAGVYAPKNRYMGNIGAIVKNDDDTAMEKQKVLQDAGAVIVPSINRIGATMIKVISDM